ncbi:hypothetical protein tinsulaeT_21880 [Thalassotalea insulae]|uniref:PEP-CTERM system TPR-repeat protein PrsT n=1 Tax=Thalassotalea insulae TaxID=2056778 RepID=A0ABQ6GSC6_9GAMM|nr:XrtA/PEP-CTERM system TPR-repeat protein PrsT [Thalassotalea insulae]GLX78848.1 hypothetical protein tinsulaeT_21880 [Thalassotalea insulae]
MLARVLVLISIVILAACSDKSSDEYLNSAKQLMDKQEYQAASIELKNAIKQSPELAEARFLLGKIYLAQSAFQSAEKEFNKALELKYPSAKVLPLLSKSYQKSRSDVALLELPHKDDGLSAEQSAEVAFYKLQAMFRLDQQEKVNALIEEIQLLETASVFKQLAFVYSLVIKEQTDAALEQLATIIKEHPKQGDALKLQAILFARTGQLAQAADVYLAYLSHYPQDNEVTFVASRLLVELNRTEEAEPLIDKLLAINENNGLLNQLKGIARYNAKDMASALAFTEKAIIATPDDPALRLLAGYSAYQMNDFEQAHQHLSLIAQDLPADHEALRMLAASQLRLGLSEQAGDTMAALEGLSDKDNALLSTVGLALIKSGDVDKAKMILEKSDELTAESAADLTRLGLLKLSLNDVSGIAKLEQALDKKPQQAFTRQTLATAYLSTKQYDKALELAKRWQADDSGDLQALMLEATVYVHQQNKALAKQKYQQILAKDPKYVGAHMALAELAIAEKDYPSAKQSIEHILAEKPNHIGALVKYYAFAVANNNQQQAFQLIQSRQQQNPDNQALRLLLAKAYLYQKQYQDSIDTLSDFPKEGAPQIYWQTLSQAYYQAKQYDQLTSLNQQWLEAEPNNKEAVISNLVLLNSQRKYDKALVISSDYLQKDKNNLEVRLFNIHFQLIKGQLEQARASFTTLEDKAKTSPFAKGLQGQLQLADEQFKDALPNLQAAYQAQPSARNVRLIQLCLRNLGQQQQAREFLAEHVKDHPSDGESLMQYAQLQIANDVDGAIKSYEHALTLNSKNFIALNNLAYFYLERQQLDKAQEYAERALAIRPEMPDVLDTAGRIYLAQKDYGQAVQHLARAVNQQNVKEEIYLNYVEALLLNGEKTLAQRKLSQRTMKQPASVKKVTSLKKQFGITP